MYFNSSTGEVVPVFFIVAFAAVIILCVAIVLARWIKNSLSPKVSVKAQIIEKNVDETHFRRHRDTFGYRTTTAYSYRITFLTEGNEQIDLYVKKLEYNKLKKGRKGKLTYQGTRYLGFESLRRSKNEDTENG